MQIRVEVLGPLAVTLDGVGTVPTAAKPRKVLALLAVRAGQVVPVPVLIKELWGEHPPASALTTLQTYILQLRRLLADALKARGIRDPGAKRVLRTAYGGYQLDADPAASDVCEFRTLAAVGSRALELGDPDTAGRVLRSALRVWRGPALQDVEPGPELDTEVRHLEESRMMARYRRIDADLATGRHNELLGELAALSSQQWMDERVCEQYMLALYRSGRRLDALAAYQRIRAELRREMALEPRPRLRRLQQAILAAAPELEVRARHPQLLLG